MMEARMKLALVLVLVGCATEQAATTEGSSTPVQKSRSSSTDTTVSPEQADAIEALFKRKATELQTCWAEEYERSHNRKLQGDLTLQMIITPQGKAKDVRILKSTLGNPAIEKCVSDAVLAWAFPEVSGNVPYTRSVHLGAQF
jgi:TonB family protein